eukprot:342907_1
MIGTHYRYGGGAVTGLDYIVLRLIDNDNINTEYLIFVSSYIQAYSVRQIGGSTLLDDYTPTSLINNIEQSIGNRFKIIFNAIISNQKINVILTIDSICKLEFTMTGQYNYKNNQWRMHHIMISPPQCYRCTICGLCGDFQGGSASLFQTCDGQEITITRGTSNILNYDANGWTYEQNYIEQNCEGITPPDNNDTPSPITPYTPETPIYVPDACDPNNREIIKPLCQQIINDNLQCCTTIGGTQCQDLADGTIEDLCRGNIIDSCDALSVMIDTECVECENNIDNICDPINIIPPQCITGDWGQWGDCLDDNGAIITCGGGIQERSRTVSVECVDVDNTETKICNTHTCNIELCEIGTNYDISGVQCVAWGDPHFTTFNGNKHDFQGNKNDLSKTQFNYMYPCIDYTFEEQPFALIGTHYPYFGRAQTGLDYVVLRLIDRDDSEYLVFLSTYIAAYTERVTSTLIDDYDINNMNILLSDISTPIGTGNRFQIIYTEISVNNRISVLLKIDNLCELKFRMSGQHQKVNNKWRMHDIIIEPPQCYKCTTCGLCGTFNIPDWTMPNCYGDTFPFSAGTFWYNAYDANAWTYEQNYIEQNCEGITPPDNNDTPSPITPYTCELPVEEPIDTCHPELKVLIKLNCANIINNNFIDCCNNISPECNDLASGIIIDQCLAGEESCDSLIPLLQDKCETCAENPLNCDITETVPPDCSVSDWSEWSDCLDENGIIKLCDGGIETRTRTINGNGCIEGINIEEERPCNTHSCLKCERGRNYIINGGVCDIWGDPHYTTWNGVKHDFQGDISIDDKLQYYYIYPCAEYTFNELPFAMIGT